MTTRHAPGFLIILPAFLAAGFAAHWPALGAFFLADDFFLVQELTGGATPGIWPSDDRFFRPLTSISLYLDATLWGLEAGWYHATSVLLHVINSLLLVRLVSSVWRATGHPGEGAGWPALLAGGLYLLHPSHTEPVSWIACRGDLLAAMFCLAALLAYAEHRKGPSPRRLPLRAPGPLTLVAVVLALLSKESALFLPALLLFLELSPWTRARAAGRSASPLLAVALFCCYPAYLLIRRAVLGQWLGGYGEQMHLELDLWRTGGSLVTYLVRSFLPPLEASPGTLLFFVACLAGAAACLRGRPGGSGPGRALLLLGAVAQLASLLPAVNMGTSLFGPQGERFIYIPTIFSAAMIAALLRSRLGGAPFIVVSLALLLASGQCLFEAQGRWQVAGSVSRGILLEVLALGDRRRVTILNLPDNINGAYVFRGGLPEAVGLFAGAEAGDRVTCVARHAMSGPRDAVTVQRRGDIIQLRLRHPRPLVPTLVSSSRRYFEPCSRTPANLKILDSEGGTLRLRIIDPARWRGALYYSEGWLRPLR